MRVAPPYVACAAVAVLLLSAGCGKDDAKPAAKASPSSTVSQLIPSGDPSTSSASPATGTELTGTGFTVHLPPGWTDITKDAQASAPKIAAAGRSATRTGDYTANLNVLTTDSAITGTPTRAQLNTLAIATRKEISPSAPETATLQLASLDGAAAVHQEGDATYGDTPYYLVQYSTIRDAKNYILTFSFPTGVDAAARDEVIDPVLASFTFT